MKWLFSFFAVFLTIGCSKVSVSLPLETSFFKYSNELIEFMEPLEKITPLVSTKKNIPLVNSTEFSVNNIYVLPFLHYQLVLNRASADSITRENLETFMRKYAYIFAKNELIAREAGVQGFSVSNEELQEAIVRSFGSRVDEFKEFIDGTSLSYDYYLNDVTQSMLIKRYQEAMVDGLDVSEEEIEDYYRDNPTASKINPQITARNIVIKFDPAKNKVKSKKTIEMIEGQLAKGADFSLLAKKYSDDAVSAAEGGLMGDVITHGSLEPYAELIVFATNVGECTKIIEHDSAFEIIKIESIEDEGTIGLEEVRSSIRHLILYMKQQRIIEDDTNRIIEKYGLSYI